MIDIKSDFIQEFCDKQLENHPLKFISSTQKLSYQVSIHNEVKNIFSGNAATAISNLMDRAVVIKMVDGFEIEDILGVDEPIAVGIQPFKLNNGRCFRAALIASKPVLQGLWKLYEDQN